MGRQKIFQELDAERERQDKKWGMQNHPIRREGEGRHYKQESDTYRQICDLYARSGSLTWYDILMEEVFEAFAESEPDRQREELVQAAAVIVSMIECLDRHTPIPLPEEHPFPDNAPVPCPCTNPCGMHCEGCEL